MDTFVAADEHTITSLEGLAKVYKAPLEAVVRKVADHVTPPGRGFIAASPFLIMATSSAQGIDCSPKGDAPGFVQLLDERTLLIPDRPGNNRIDGMKNLIGNPQIGLIFMVPGADETYRVNGRARISIEPRLLDRFLVQGKRPRAVIVVAVEEAFSHCPKALVRSGLWQAAAQGRPPAAPTHGHFAAHRDGKDESYAATYDTEYAARILRELY